MLAATLAEVVVVIAICKRFHEVAFVSRLILVVGYVFLTYRLLHAYNDGGVCPCVGAIWSLLADHEHLVSTILYSSLVYMIAGSIAFWRSTVRSAIPNDSFVITSAEGGSIER
jgi:hypothetical protein